MTKFHRLEIKPSPSHRKTSKMTDLRHMEQQLREREKENSIVQELQLETMRKKSLLTSQLHT